jgi:RNA polymerase sigma-70 factor, ECF subfamily
LREAADEEAWRRLVHLYTPLLFSWARRAGQDEHAAADLVQEVFMILLRTLPTFKSDGRGKFRGWLRTIMLNKLRDRKRREAREEKAAARLAPASEAPDMAELFWEGEYQRELTRRALQLMQEEFASSTWKACWETVVVGRPSPEVAAELGITENAVYIAKCRVLRRLRHELSGLVE